MLQLRRTMLLFGLFACALMFMQPASAKGPDGEISLDTPLVVAPTCDPRTSLAGWFTGTTGKIYNSSSCTFDVGIASYKKFNELISQQVYFASATTTIGPNMTISLTVAIPDCAAQVDVFWGPVLYSLENERYGERLLSAIHIGGTNYCSNATPTPTAAPTTPPTTPPTATPTAPPTATPTAPPTATPTTPPNQGCTYTQGYWKNHSKQWPVSQLTIGGVTYSKTQLIEILRTAPHGDATYILIHQLIAAKLNVANGASSTAVAATIAAADAWLAAHPLGSNPANPDRQVGIDYSVTLDQYNNGVIGPGHCR